MEKKYYFISGLPRTGSTVLSSILNQNPLFHSGPYSPVLDIISELELTISRNEMFLAYPKPEQVSGIMNSILTNYHADRSEPIIFDKCRVWSDHVHMIRNYFGIEPKIIVTTRNLHYILSSFIRIVKKNSYDISDLRLNFIDKWLVSCNLEINDNNRCDVLMDKNGVVGSSIISLVEGMGKNPECLHLVDYDQLVMNPVKVIKGIYAFLGEEYFEHNFKNIVNENKINDIYTYGLSGLHDVRSELKFSSPDPQKILSKYVLSKYSNPYPWKTMSSLTD